MYKNHKNISHCTQKGKILITLYNLYKCLLQLFMIKTQQFHNQCICRPTSMVKIKTVTVAIKKLRKATDKVK